jgi:hypothetical protein
MNNHIYDTGKHHYLFATRAHIQQMAILAVSQDSSDSWSVATGDRGRLGLHGCHGINRRVRNLPVRLLAPERRGPRLAVKACGKGAMWSSMRGGGVEGSVWSRVWESKDGNFTHGYGYRCVPYPYGKGMCTLLYPQVVPIPYQLSHEHGTCIAMYPWVCSYPAHLLSFFHVTPTLVDLWVRIWNYDFYISIIVMYSTLPVTELRQFDFNQICYR